MVKPKTPYQIAAEQKHAGVWLKIIQPRDFPGYVDNIRNRDIIFKYIYERFDGNITVESLSAAAEANYLNLDGLGIAHAEGKVARAKAAAAKVLQEKRDKIRAEGMKNITRWISDVCPRALIVNGDLFPADGDKLVAFIHSRYPKIASSDESVTFEHLNDAVTVLWDSLAKFSTEPQDLLLRNQPKPQQKQLSDKMLIESGQKTDPSMRRTHTDDKPLVSEAEVRERAKKAFLKVHGIEDPEIAAFRIKAEQISVSNNFGKLDHVKTAELRKIFAYNLDKSVNWKVTYDLRWKAADQIERLKGRR